MAWDTIDDFKKRHDNTVVKPFGDTPVDPLTGNPLYGNKSLGNTAGHKLGDIHGKNHASLLRDTFEDGKVKLYSDPKGIAERVEIALPEATVVINKDYGFAQTLAHYKEIDIVDLENNPKGKIEIVPIDRKITHTAYRFFYEGSEIGKGNGDIGLFIAQALVSRTIQPRSGMGTGVDEEVFDTIKGIVNSKKM